MYACNIIYYILACILQFLIYNTSFCRGKDSLSSSYWKIECRMQTTAQLRLKWISPTFFHQYYRLRTSTVCFSKHRQTLWKRSYSFLIMLFVFPFTVIVKVSSTSFSFSWICPILSLICGRMGCFCYCTFYTVGMNETFLQLRFCFKLF